MKTNINIRLSSQQQDLLRQGKTINITISLSLDAVTLFQSQNPVIKTCPFLHFFSLQIVRQKTNGSARTSETYKAAYNKLRAFLKGDDIETTAIDGEMMEAFQSFMRSQGLSMNTISFYMRIVRAVYHRAVEQGATVDSHPFSRVFTGSQNTVKRALSLDEIRRIKQLRLTDPGERLARDLFLFSFYTRGMSFVDLAYLKKDYIHDGVVAYTRRKTGRMLTIRWEQCMQQIVNRYPSKTKYLLPIIHSEGSCERNQYRTVQDRINRLLKSIGDKAMIRQNLTMYCARHSWATIAREQKMPISVISHAMGHTNERTTEVYLKSIDSTVIDNCNREIISLLE